MDFFRAVSYVLVRLVSNQRSLKVSLVVFLLLGAADLLFYLYIFPYYESLLTVLSAKNLIWSQVDIGYAPVVWLMLFALVLGTLVIVISFAAQHIPKLIDIYMEDWMSLAYVWLLIGGTVHSILVKLLFDVGIEASSSLFFNTQFLMIVCIFLGFPYALSILGSTKPQNVINQILKNNLELINNLTLRVTHFFLTKRQIYIMQRRMFEMLNQLNDLLVFVPYKEPKAEIIQGIGNILQHYVFHKAQFPTKFFKISESIREDISFKTMKGKLDEVEQTHTFYEQKSLRLIGNVYNTFLETQHFDLSTFCVAQLNHLGRTAVEAKEFDVVDLITVRFNTHFRFALKHGQHRNEPRNLYNLAFHYGQFIGHLVEFRMVAQVKSCFNYLRFYNNECFKACSRAPSLAFILDTIAAEMQKILIATYENDWPEEEYAFLLDQFLLLDNPPNIEHSVVGKFFQRNQGIRIIQIGMGLYYLHHGIEPLAKKVVEDTLQDLELMTREQFDATLKTIYARLRFSGPNYWEDTDRGNLNIYYTPFQDSIDRFQELQNQSIACMEEMERAQSKNNR